MKEASLYRVIDANLNRAREGLRVMEEVARFIVETKKFAKKIKALRGQLQKAIKQIPSPEKIVLSRNSSGDIGKELNPKTEFKRDSLSGLFQANAKRVQEALRVLEEFSKLLAGGKATSTSFKALRFKVYQTEKDFIKAHH
jgi:thiamine-phosphate pyrophosphorylase